jgi:hypothetical protein
MIGKYLHVCMYWQTDLQKQTHVDASPSEIAPNPVTQSVGLNSLRLLNKSDCMRSGNAEFRIASNSGYPTCKAML